VKLKVAKSCYVLITELGVHLVTTGINCQDFIPNETNFNFDSAVFNVVACETFRIDMEMLFVEARQHFNIKEID
jgi:hypothetical protein